MGSGTARAIGWTAAAWTYLVARIVYLPLYGFGVPKVRTIAFLGRRAAGGTGA